MTTRTTAASGSRFYSVPDGEGGTIDLPSVTTILRIVDKPALIRWAAKEVAEYAVNNISEVNTLIGKGDLDGAIRLLKGSPWSKRDKAANVGTSVHAAIENLILGGEAEVPTAALPYVGAFKAFVADFPAGKFEASEMTVFSLKYGYAGTLDALFDFGGRLGALDWKTRQGKSREDVSAYDTELLQVSAYINAEFYERPDGTIGEMPAVDGGSIVMLCDDGYATSKVHKDSDFAGFLAALNLHKWRESL